MATNQICGFIQRLRGVLRDRAGLTDGQLLGDYLSHRDEAAIAALVRRHGPMVWGVCRRVLHNHHDAEDAFQTTFLVLVRKAASIASRELLANWLYGVAHQTALKARATGAKRKGRERQATEMPEPAASLQDQWHDLQPLLDEELSRLPAKYRGVIVLCDLEGKTRRDAAVQLGCPEGTVASRSVRARTMLAKRLTRRGVALSGGALAAVLAQQAASAGVPASVAACTIKAATLLAAGKAAATGAISVKVAALTKGVLKTMVLTKLKSVMAVLGIATMVGLIGYGIARGQQKAETAAPQKQESEPKAQKDAVVKEKAEKEAAIAWGKEVDGLQTGLAAEAATCRPGDKLKFTVKLRNVGKADIKITHGLLQEYPPQVTDTDGVRMSVYMPIPKGYKVRATELTIKPGETITLYEPEVAVEPEALMRLEGIMRVDTPTICVGPGKYKIAYGGMIQSHPKLATSTVEFEVKDQVAWGKEANGLQAGLFNSNADDVRIGGKAKMVVKLRNVSKETVKVSVWPLWTCYPGVVDTRGKRVPTTTAPTPLFEIIPTALSLKPGETVDVGRADLLVAEPDQKVTVPDGVVDLCAIHVKPGMYKADCIGFLKENHTLATGTVEFEVKEAAKPAEAFTEWGKEIEGLQAGLGYKAGEKRAYTHGETVKLVVRVRNVSMEAVKFQYLREFFIETPPTVMDGAGKPVPLGRINVSGLIHLPVDVNLAPGKEIELTGSQPFYELELELKPASRYGTGKFQLQYERVFGNSSSGGIKLDPTLSKLATGKLELEIKPEAPANTRVKAPEKQEEQDKDAKMKPIKLRVYIEKVNAETQTITASCMLRGQIDNVTKPLRLENLRVSENAMLMESGKEIKFKLTDLKLDAGYFLYLKTYEDGLGFEVVGIEKISVGK